MLLLSVPPEVKTISSGRTERNAATRPRARSMARRATRPSAWAEEGLAQARPMADRMSRMTHRRRPRIAQPLEEGGTLFGSRALTQLLQRGMANVRIEIEHRTVVVIAEQGLHAAVAVGLAGAPRVDAFEGLGGRFFG